MALQKLTAKERSNLFDEIRATVSKVFPDRTRDFHPLVEIALIAANPNNTAATAYKANVELASYFFSKPKPIENDPEKAQAPTVVINQFSGGRVMASFGGESPRPFEAGEPPFIEDRVTSDVDDEAPLSPEKPAHLKLVDNTQQDDPPAEPVTMEFEDDGD